MPQPCWNGFLRLSLVSCPIYLSLAADENELTEKDRIAFHGMSSDIIDLVRFVDRAEIDPLHLNTSYYVYPDGKLAAEPFRVIAEKMAAKGLVGIARVTLSNNRRLLMFEPRGAGMIMYTLWSPGEMRAPEFDTQRQQGIDPEMLDITETVVERRRGTFDPVGLLSDES